jgi:hypothetical protein
VEFPRGHEFLKGTYIGYDFDFDITEVNNAGTLGDRGKLTFTKTRPSGSLTLDLEGAAAMERAAQRTFRIIESLEKLLTADCSREGTRANLLYPITGTIGMNEIVRTYVGLERLTTLKPVLTGGGAEVGDIPSGPSSTPVVFSDVLTFTTRLGAGVKPTLELNAVGVGNLRLTHASIFGDATRVDVHKLTVVLARDPKAPEPPERSFSARRQQESKDKERTYEEKIKSYMNNTTAFALSNNLSYSPYNLRLIQKLDALARKDINAETQVLVELERRRSKEEEDIFMKRLIEILKPGP